MPPWGWCFLDSVGNRCALLLPHPATKGVVALPAGHTRRIDDRRTRDSRPAADFAALVNIERPPRNGYVVSACSCLGIGRDITPKRQIRGCRRVQCPRNSAILR